MSWRALVLLLSAAWLTAAAKPRAPLDADPRVAQSGCVAVLSVAGVMFAQPPPELARRMVPVAGLSTLQRYVSTPAFLQDTLAALCNSAALAEYRLEPGVLGGQRWREDDVPSYVPRPVPASLASLCRLLVRRHKAALSAALKSRTPPSEACQALLGAPAEHGSLQSVVAGLDAAAVLRLSPFLLVAALLPLVLKPLFCGPPPLPEPRGPAEPGDHGAEHEAVVGCVGPAQPASRRARKAGAPL